MKMVVLDVEFTLVFIGITCFCHLRMHSSGITYLVSNLREVMRSEISKNLKMNLNCVNEY